jgi:GNAT superfamily N-acetyltransferase
VFILKSTYSYNQFFISTNKELLNLDVIEQFICHESYWGKGMTRDLLVKSIENSSLCFGLFDGNPQEKSSAKQIGFARVITDFVRFAYLADVFVIKEYRGQGLSKWLIETIVSEPRLKGAAFHLTTKDAHSLYEKFGFCPIDQPENRMLRSLNMEQIHEAYKKATDN